MHDSKGELPPGYKVDLNADADENRALAAFMSDLYRETIMKTMDAGLSLGKWVLTSLLAINGGAAIATWGLSMQPEMKVGACALFVAGIISALLSGYLTVKSIPERLRPIGEALGYWVTVRHDGERVAEMEGEQDRIAASDKRASRWPDRAGWTSLAFFVVGSALAAAGALDFQVQTGSQPIKIPSHQSSGKAPAPAP